MNATGVEQERQIFASERGEWPRIAAHNCISEIAILLLQFDHAVFDCSSTHESDGVHGASLSDAMGAVDRLGLDRWIPPRVEQDDAFGALEVEPDAASLQAEEEDRTMRVAVEAADPLCSVASRTVEVLVEHAAPIELFAHER